MIILLSLFAACVIGSLLIIFYMLNDLSQSYWRKRFEQSIKNGIQHNKLKNKDIYILANRWAINKKYIQPCLENILNHYMDAPAACKKDLERIRNIIYWHKSQIPFSELPDDVTTQLRQLQLSSNSNRHTVSQLSQSLGELYSSNRKKGDRERLISKLSLLIGFIGTAFTIITIIYPNISK